MNNFIWSDYELYWINKNKIIKISIETNLIDEMYIYTVVVFLENHLDKISLDDFQSEEKATRFIEENF